MTYILVVLIAAREPIGVIVWVPVIKLVIVLAVFFFGGLCSGACLRLKLLMVRCQ